MRQGKKSFRHESLQDAAAIQEIMAAISDGIASGKVTFSDSDDRIIMRPEGLLHMKVTASQEEDRDRISIRVSWQVEDKRGKKKKPLRVSAK
ncbi:MAG: amphi-Trp domain-containing protein [Gammaproteobacteria bacterium]|jgi:amphi-Trp domain-containing protein